MATLRIHETNSNAKSEAPNLTDKLIRVVRGVRVARE